MTPSVETAIWLALKRHIEALPTTYPVAWPGAINDIPTSGGHLEPYLRVSRISADPQPAYIADGKPHVRTGSLVITLVHPLSRYYDITRFTHLAGEIAAHFVDGTEARNNGVCVRVPRYPAVQEGYEDNGYWAAPVIIPWRAFA